MDTLSPPVVIGAPARLRESAAARPSHRFAHVFVGTALAFALVAAAVGDTFFLRLGTEALIYAGLAMSVDLLLGFTGMLSLGQALFFGVGAYTSALVLKHVAPSFWLAITAAVLAGAIGGVVGGLISTRARGVYFALITFGMAQVVSKVVYNTRALGASDGIIGIPVVDVELVFFRVNSANPPMFFLLVLALVTAAYFGIAYVLGTPFGRALVAIRTNEGRVPFLGYETRRHKLVAYVLAATLAAFSGALYPVLRGFVSPELMYFSTSGDAVITVIVGGLGTLVGAIWGSVVLTGLKSVIGTYTVHYPIVIGSLFVLAVIAFPRGIVGYLRGLRGRGEP